MRLDTTTGIEVPLDKIEQNFNQVWEQTLSNDQDTPSVKASSLNLIVTFQNRNEFLQTLEIIPEITEHHPGRIIMIFIDPDSTTEILTSKISAFCHPPREDGIQICCELVTIETGTGGAKHLSGTLLPLLLPDLPVFWWSPDNLVLNNESLTHFHKNIERTILDCPDTFTTLEDFLIYIKNTIKAANNSKISDLQWARLTNWREAIARMFDSRDGIKQLQTINQIHIKYSGENISSLAYLIAGWLASRLNWQFRGQSDSEFIFVNQKGSPVSLFFQGVNSKFVKGEIKSVVLISSGNSKNIQWKAKEDKNTIKLYTILYEKSRKTDTLLNTCLSDSWLIGNELDYVRADDIYLNTVKLLKEMLNTEQGHNHEVY